MRKSANTKFSELAEFVLLMRDTMPMWTDISVEAIARELGESPKRVRDLMRDLKQSEQARFRTGIDWRKLGYTLYFVYAEPADLKSMNNAFHTLSGSPGVVSTYAFGTGHERLVSKAWVKPEDYDDFLDSINERVGNDVLGISTEHVSKHYLDDSFSKAPHPTEVLDADATDMQLIRLLRDDGLLTYRELADRVGLSAPSVFERVKRLRDEGVIVGYAPRFVWGPQRDERGFSGRMYCWLKVARSDLDALGEELMGTYTKALQVRSAYSMYGSYNLHFSMLVKDYAPVPQMLNGLVQRYDVHSMVIPHLISVKWNQSPNPFPKN